MIIRQQLIQETEFIRLVADLELDPHSPISLLKAGMQACERSQQCRLLLEMPTVGPVAMLSRVILGFGMADAYEQASKHMSVSVRVAALGNTDLVTEVRPVEDEFVSRGLPFRTFDNEPEALSWLLMED